MAKENAVERFMRATGKFLALCALLGTDTFFAAPRPGHVPPPGVT